MNNNQYKWYFATIANGSGKGVNDGLTDLFSGDIYQNLMRESIQNIIDARLKPAPGEKALPARVVFRLKKYNCEDFTDVLTLKKHIDICVEKYPSASKFASMQERMKQKEMYMLEVADYNTTGMDYDEPTDTGKFRKFVRYAGDPNSDDDAGGSHGYGKITYFNMSGIKTILVSSMYYKDHMCTFEGAARLASHPTGTVRLDYDDTGFLDDGTGVPVQEKAEQKDENGNYILTKIPRLLQRHEPGTSVFIPFVNITEETLPGMFKACSEAVLRSFFAAIEAGILEVNIDFGMGYSVDFTQAELANIFSSRFFTLPVDKVKRKVLETLNPHPYWLAYKYNPEVTVEPDTEIEEARSLCTGKQYVRIGGMLPILGKVSLYTYLSPEGNDVIIYMRSPRMMVNCQRLKSPGKRGFSAVFVCEDETGNKLLRRMEDAAHTKWSTDQLRRDNRPDGDIQQALKIEAEMADFLNYCIDQILFPPTITDEEDVMLPDFTMPIITEDDCSNPLVGSLISIQGTDSEQTGAPVDINVGTTNQKKSKIRLGVAQVLKKKKVKEDPKGPDTAGPGKTPGGVNPEPGTSGKDTYSEDEQGEEMLVREKLNIKYRVISDMGEDGKVTYSLIVTSPVETEKAYIQLIPVGEAESSDSIAIQSATEGKVKGNELTNVALKEGKNVILFDLSETGEYTFTVKAEHEVKVKR